MNIILASASPRRKELLSRIGLPFTAEASSASEAYDSNSSPAGIVRELAQRKARQVARGKHDALVIGADTIVLFQGLLLEKPSNFDDAFRMLRRLNDNTHEVLTGVALIKVDDEGNIAGETTFYERTEVTFGKLEEDEIRKYVESGSPMDKAGGYGIQDNWGALFVKKINGDYYNVVGFPLHSFYDALKRFAPELVAQKKINLKNER